MTYKEEHLAKYEAHGKLPPTPPPPANHHLLGPHQQKARLRVQDVLLHKRICFNVLEKMG